MTFYLIIFYAFAALSVGSAVYALFCRNLVHTVLALLGVFLGVSGLFVFAGADFLALAQLVIYVGGVLVLMLFGVMFTQRNTTDGAPGSGFRQRITGVGLALAFLALLVWLFLLLPIPYEKVTWSSEGSIRPIGRGLLTEYLIPFELAGVLLLLALIGAVHIASKRNS